MSTTLTTSLSVQPSSSGTRLRSLLRTRDEFAPTLARLALGLVTLPHGCQKTLGWFGGYGFTGTMHWFTETMHLPWILGFAAILAESLGGLALILGFASRIAALGVGAVFVVAATTLHAEHGFFMNWFGNQKGEGLEYFVLGLALVAIVAVRGGGTLSLDRALTRNL
jgi:putative oxidoreductase